MAEKKAEEIEAVFKVALSCTGLTLFSIGTCFFGLYNLRNFLKIRADIYKQRDMHSPTSLKDNAKPEDYEEGKYMMVSGLSMHR